MLLCAAPESVIVTSRVVAAEIETPYNHVSKALLRLRELGLVEAIRGRNGGVRISALGRGVSVGYLLRHLDTSTDLAACDTPNGTCPLLQGCGLRGALRRAKEAFYRELDDLVVSALPHGKQEGPVLVELGLVR